MISTHIKEIGQELYQSRDHKDRLTSIDINTSIDMAASAGDNRFEKLKLKFIYVKYKDVISDSSKFCVPKVIFWRSQKRL